MNQPIKRMLINATYSEEIRVATISGNRLDDIDIEHPSREQKKSNIYLATISRIEPSLEAVFVNYGANKHGFLPLKEIEKSYFLKQTANPKTDIKKILKEGQELLIQVEKEERGNKGAALTTYISLAGCYLVLMANNPKAGGISRRIEGDERNDMREILSSLVLPDDMGVIIRTAGLGKKIADLQWDLDVLLQHWTAIKKAAGTLTAPCLLHQESNVIIRAIRDNLRPNIKEILIDDEELYVQAKQYIEILRSDSKNVVKLYKDDVPLFTRFQIESQIEEAYQHEIRLPSGGSLVFDRTEALTAVDINSAQSTKGQDIENTAFHTNLEAADEIARQLRLRDVGGLIVIDFIDMENVKHQREVENRLRTALENDRARVQTGRISRFGILEMSRQRLKTSLGENSQVICSKCSGKGSVRTIESLSLSLLRLIEEESLKQNTKEVQAQLPIELCTFLANEKRNNILEIEKRSNTRIVLIPNQYYTFPHYQINRIKLCSPEAGIEKSYHMVSIPEEGYNFNSDQLKNKNKNEKAAVQQLNLPNYDGNTKPSILKRLWSSLFTNAEDNPNISNTNSFAPIKSHEQNDFKSNSNGFERSSSQDKNFRKQPRGNKDNRGNHDNRDSRDTRDNNNNRDNRNIGNRPQRYKELDKDKVASHDLELNNDKEYINSDNHTQKSEGNINKFNNKSRNRSRRKNRNRHSDSQNQPYTDLDSNLNASSESKPNFGSDSLSAASHDNFFDTKSDNSEYSVNQGDTLLHTTPTSRAITETISKEDFVVDSKKTKNNNKRLEIVESSVDTKKPVEISIKQEIVIKKATDRVKITPAGNMSKRSFHPKKKLPFAVEKYSEKKFNDTNSSEFTQIENSSNVINNTSDFHDNNL